jgi:hypothetical protein
MSTSLWTTDPQAAQARDWHAGVELAKQVARCLDTDDLQQVWRAAYDESHRVPVGRPGAFSPDDTFAWGYLGCLGSLLDDRVAFEARDHGHLAAGDGSAQAYFVANSI